MPSNPQNHPHLDLTRVLKSGGRSTKSDEDASDEEDFDAKAYFWAAWELVKQDVSLLVWKFAADFLRALVALGTAFFLGAVLVWQVGAALEADAGPIAGLEALVERLASPGYVVGATGVLFCAWLIALMIEVLVLSGIWGAFSEGVRGRRVEFLRTFFSGLSRHFPAVLGLRLCTLAAQAVVALLASSVILALIAATTTPGALAGGSVWLRALMWAAPLTVVSALAILVRLTMEVAAAPLIVEGRSVGGAILEGAALVTRKFVPIYRLLVVAATLMLVPLFLYWGVLMLQNLALVVTELAGILSMLRLAGDLFVFASAGVVGVLFYGALFFYYADEMGIIDQLPGRRNKDGGDGDDAKRDRGSRRRSGGPRRGFDEDASLEELLPDEYPNIVSLDDVLQRAPERAPDQSDEPDESDAAGDASSEDEPPDPHTDQTSDDRERRD